jgi:hypothetical protein
MYLANHFNLILTQKHQMQIKQFHLHLVQVISKILNHFSQKFLILQFYQ